MTSLFRPIAFFVVLLAAAGGVLLVEYTRPKTLIVQGEVEATRIDLATQVPGRVSSVNVEFGDRVSAGETVVILSSPQLEAAMTAVEAAFLVAKANRNLVFSTRAEVIDARSAELERARAALVLAEKNHERIFKLVERSTASVQQLDEALNNLSAAQRAVQAATANLKLSQNGSSAEEKAVAEAQVAQAAAAVQRTSTDLKELTISVPIDGQVTARLAEPGELFSAGAILLSVVDIDNAWFTFNIREDLLGDIAIGDVLDLRVPALNDRIVAGRIKAINAEGSYANWRATKATGDFDLRTFSVRIEPLTQDLNLRPGMSALITLQKG